MRSAAELAKKLGPCFRELPGVGADPVAMRRCRRLPISVSYAFDASLPRLGRGFHHGFGGRLLRLVPHLSRVRPAPEARMQRGSQAVPLGHVPPGIYSHGHFDDNA